MRAPAETLDAAALIRAASADDHRATESRGFITRLMGGELGAADWMNALDSTAIDALTAEVPAAFAANGSIFDELEL